MAACLVQHKTAVNDSPMALEGIADTAKRSGARAAGLAKQDSVCSGHVNRMVQPRHIHADPMTKRP